MILNGKYFLIAIILSFAITQAQDKKANIVNQLKVLKLKIFSYLQARDIKDAHSSANQGFKLALENNIDSLTGIFLDLNGYLYYVENNYEPAIRNYQKALIYYNKSKRDKRLGNTYLNIGICEKKLSRYDIANIYYFKAADKFLRIKDTSDLSDTYNSIGLCFLSLNSQEKCLTYHRKALALRTKLYNQVLIAQSLNNIGYSFKLFNSPDSAIWYIAKSVKLYQKQRDSSLLVLPLQNLGSAYKVKGKLNLSERYIRRSLIIANNYEMKEELARGNLDLAELYLVQKKYNEALAAVSITENTAKPLKLPELLMQAYADKYALYQQKGDYKKALYYNNEKDKLKDSIFSTAKDKAINELEIKYQTSLKEKDIAALSLKNKLQGETVSRQKLSIIVLAVGAVLLSALFVIAYNNYRIKDRANQRIHHLMQELHHRVKNNLQILSGLFTMQIENLSDEATKNALRENEARLTSMNLIHNKLYLDHSNTKIEMEDYLTKLLHHIKASFGGTNEKNISLRIDVDPVMIEADKAVAIGLIVNELATNAFKYAFDGKKGEIYLGLKQESKAKILLSLGDNGKGISTVHKEKGASFGLKLVNLMARQLNSVLVVENSKGAVYRMEINV